MAEQPEIKAWGAANKAAVEAVEQMSFCGRGLNLPGTLIEFELDGKLERRLIGDIDTNGGICGCCADVRGNMVVTRYARVPL